MGLMLVGCGKSKPTKKLRYGIYELGTNLNPFFYTGENDKTILNLSFITLFAKDRNGELVYDISDVYGKEINGFTYNAPASLKVTSEDENYIYTINLKENIYSSSGDEYTINDLIFDFYVLFDPSSNLDSYKNLPLQGLNEYYLDLKDNSKYNDAHIEGIIKRNKTSMSLVMTRELTNEEKKLLNIYLVPKNIIDTKVNFSYDVNLFGFKKGDISNLKSKSLVQLSTGPYIITSSSENKVTLKRNQAYYFGMAKTEFIDIIKINNRKYDEDGYTISGGDPFYQIDKDWMDFALVEINDTTLDEIPRYNRNDKLIGNSLSLFEISGTTKGIVYSSDRFDGSILSSLGLNDHHTILDEIAYIKTK